MFRSLIAVGTPCSGGRSRTSGVRTACSAARACAQRAVSRHRHERADLGVEPVDAGECVLDQLDRADLAGAHRLGRLERGEVVQFAAGIRRAPLDGRGDGTIAAAEPTVLRPREGSPRRCPADRGSAAQDGSRTAHPMTTATVARRLHRRHRRCQPSSASSRSPLRWLHRAHAATTFVHTCGPPRERGRTWSIVSARAPQ